MGIIEYLREFLIQSNWLDENVPEQARALFTSWCLMENVDADTSRCDLVLSLLFRAALVSDCDIGYDEFENYMVALVV